MVLLLWIICVIYVLWLACFPLCLLMPCSHLLGKSWTLASRLWRLIVFLSLSHVVSVVRCGTWLYRFLIFATFLTFMIMLLVMKTIGASDLGCLKYLKGQGKVELILPFCICALRIILWICSVIVSMAFAQMKLMSVALLWLTTWHC